MELLKRIIQLQSPDVIEALLRSADIEYLIGPDWVTYAGGGMCKKMHKSGKSDMDVTKITDVRVRVIPPDINVDSKDIPSTFTPSSTPPSQASQAKVTKPGSIGRFFGAKE